MSKNISKSFLTLVLVCFFFGIIIYFLYTKNNINIQKQKLETSLLRIESTSNTQRLSEVTPFALAEGSEEKTKLIQIRDAYNNFNISKNDKEELLNKLTILSQGLVADNAIVRHTTEDFITHLLTRWVYYQPEVEWHKNASVDHFFKAFRTTQNKILMQFLNNYKDGPEFKYLSQLSKEKS
jgi:hypothetical protein